jgi:Terminase large subunit, T4likevirus-type, N-terminal
VCEEAIVPTLSRGSLGTRLIRLEGQARNALRADPAALDRLQAEPTRIMAAAGMTPDAWQERVLRSDAEQMSLLCCRQAGKSSVSAALALSTALLKPASPVLLLSPSDRQSAELFRKVVELYDAVGRPVPTLARTARRLELANGSRVVSLPGTERTIRGFSGVRLLVIDEAARVDDTLYFAVRPMLAVSGGRLVALSTPYGKRGWFHDEWHGDGTWERIRVPATECSRISPEFLESERRSLGDRWFRQEYLTEFAETMDAVFSFADIQAARSSDVQPLFPLTEASR